MATTKTLTPEQRIRREQARLKKDMIVWIEDWAQHWLINRRMCGVSDPDQKEWSVYATQYMLVWLMLYQQCDGTPIESTDVPSALRDRLRDPLYGDPATDIHLRALSVHPPWKWRTLNDTILELRGERWRTREEIGEMLGIVAGQLPD